MEKRALAAREDAQKRGLTALLAKLEALAEISQPVIAMGFSVCDDILRSDKYRNYHQCLKLDERNPAKAADHSVRVMVGERVFPIYAEHLIYAALSPDGRGLLVTVRSQYGGTSPPRILAGERRSSKKTRSLFSITMASACAALSYRGATERFGKSG